MISSESVAMITSSGRGEERTALYTRPIRGCPPISRSILRGILVEASRAGITATIRMDFMQFPHHIHQRAWSAVFRNQGRGQNRANSPAEAACELFTSQ